MLNGKKLKELPTFTNLVKFKEQDKKLPKKSN